MPDFTDNLKPASPDGPETLQKERSGSKLNSDELAKHLLSRNNFLERQKRVVSVLQSDPLFNKKNQLNLSRPDRYHLGLARAKAMRRLVKKHGWDEEDFKIAEYLTDEMSPYHLTHTMFITSIREQSDAAQKAYWLPKVEAWDIIGAYGQTELGHGSNVRGLECQAIWDPKTTEFIIHSPTLTASKWWNGALGRTANHAIVVAQLLLPEKGGKYKSYGPHQFIMPIRDMKTNQPLDGIVIGDIGPKYGYASMDNGYMLFNKVRVPHSAMLARYQRVDPYTGAYTRPENPAVVYGSLTFVRAQIIVHARLILSRAVTVGVRYTSIRRQFQDRDAQDTSSPEMAVLDYPTVQIRILPLLATTFALHYTGEAMNKLYWQTRENIEKKADFSALAELHSASSGLKSLCTTYAADGIETCRRALGGHGFGGGSGLIPLNADYLSKISVEGDNGMIGQQTASHLIKKMSSAIQKQNSKSADSTDTLYTQYLANKGRPLQHSVLGDDGAIVTAFRHRAAALAYHAYQARVVKQKSWTSLMIELHKLSRAHSQTLVVSSFYDAVFTTPSAELSAFTQGILRDLFRLFSLYTMDVEAREFSASGAVSEEELNALPARILELMTEKIRPHAVKLVDAWSIPDYLLDSALGRYDGQVYQDLFKRAHKENPLNKITFNPDWRNEEIVMGANDMQKLLAKL